MKHQWHNIFGTLGSTVMLFSGGYLMTNQPTGVSGDPFAAGLWATILGSVLAIGSILYEVNSE